MELAPRVDTEEGLRAWNENRRGWEVASEQVDPADLVTALRNAKTRRIGPPIEDEAKIEKARAATPEGETFKHPVDAYVNVDSEIADQEEAALRAVDAVVASGALGTAPLTAGISGHANPGNKHITGHTTDHISISLGQVAPVHPDVLAEIEGGA